jgi:hypothetical protein
VLQFFKAKLFNFNNIFDQKFLFHDLLVVNEFIGKVLSFLLEIEYECFLKLRVTRHLGAISC